MEQPSTGPYKVYIKRETDAVGLSYTLTSKMRGQNEFEGRENNGVMEFLHDAG